MHRIRQHACNHTINAWPLKTQSQPNQWAACSQTTSAAKSLNGAYSSRRKSAAIGKPLRGGRALALADLVLPDLVDVGQHLGHGQVKSGGDFLLQLRGLIDRPRQRLQRQDIVLGTDLADLQRQEDTFKMFKFKFKFKSRHLFIPQGNKSESH